MEHENTAMNLCAKISIIIHNTMIDKNITAQELAYKLCRRHTEVIKWLSTPFNYSMSLLIEIGLELDIALLVTT